MEQAVSNARPEHSEVVGDLQISRSLSDEAATCTGAVELSLKPEQCAQARALLGWTEDALGAAAGQGDGYFARRLERGYPMDGAVVRELTLALEDAGILFAPDTANPIQLGDTKKVWLNDPRLASYEQLHPLVVPANATVVVRAVDFLPIKSPHSCMPNQLVVAWVSIEPVQDQDARTPVYLRPKGEATGLLFGRDGDLTWFVSAEDADQVRWALHIVSEAAPQGISAAKLLANVAYAAGRRSMLREVRSCEGEREQAAHEYLRVRSRQSAGGNTTAWKREENIRLRRRQVLELATAKLNGPVELVSGKEDSAAKWTLQRLATAVYNSSPGDASYESVYSDIKALMKSGNLSL